MRNETLREAAQSSVFSLLMGLPLTLRQNPFVFHHVIYRRKKHNHCRSDMALRHSGATVRIEAVL